MEQGAPSYTIPIVPVVAADRVRRPALRRVGSLQADTA